MREPHIAANRWVDDKTSAHYRFTLVNSYKSTVISKIVSEEYSILSHRIVMGNDC